NARTRPLIFPIRIRLTRPCSTGAPTERPARCFTTLRRANEGEAAMPAMTATKFDVVPLSTHIGAEIRGLDLRERPDEETIRAIYQAWLDHLVIVFPDQKLSQEDLVRVTGYFGELSELSRPAKYFPKCPSETILNPLNRLCFKVVT